MKARGIKQLLLILVIISILPSALWAHKGRIDGNGGHHDNKNVSGLGDYHYHCGLDGNGYPAHLHTNGCPYAHVHLEDIGKETTSETPHNGQAHSGNQTGAENSGQSEAGDIEAVPDYQEKEMVFVIDGRAVKISAITIQQTNLVELKTLCKELGITMKYDPEMKTIECQKGSAAFLLQIGSKNIWQGEEENMIEVAPVAYKGRTMVPARVVAEAIGKKVTYDGANDQIIIK